MYEGMLAILIQKFSYKKSSKLNLTEIEAIFESNPKITKEFEGEDLSYAENSFIFSLDYKVNKNAESYQKTCEYIYKYTQEKLTSFDFKKELVDEFLSYLSGKKTSSELLIKFNDYELIRRRKRVNKFFGKRIYHNFFVNFDLKNDEFLQRFLRISILVEDVSTHFLYMIKAKFTPELYHQLGLEIGVNGNELLIDLLSSCYGHSDYSHMLKGKSFITNGLEKTFDNLDLYLKLMESSNYRLADVLFKHYPEKFIDNINVFTKKSYPSSRETTIELVNKNFSNIKPQLIKNLDNNKSKTRQFIIETFIKNDYLEDTEIKKSLVNRYKKEKSKLLKRILFEVTWAETITEKSKFKFVNAEYLLPLKEANSDENLQLFYQGSLNISSYDKVKFLNSIFENIVIKEFKESDFWIFSSVTNDLNTLKIKNPADYKALNEQSYDLIKTLHIDLKKSKKTQLCLKLINFLIRTEYEKIVRLTFELYIESTGSFQSKISEIMFYQQQRFQYRESELAAIVEKWYQSDCPMNSRLILRLACKYGGEQVAILMPKIIALLANRKERFLGQVIEEAFQLNDSFELLSYIYNLQKSLKNERVKVLFIHYMNNTGMNEDDLKSYLSQ